MQTTPTTLRTAGRRGQTGVAAEVEAHQGGCVVERIGGHGGDLVAAQSQCVQGAATNDEAAPEGGDGVVGPTQPQLRGVGAAGQGEVQVLQGPGDGGGRPHTALGPTVHHRA